MQEIVTKWEEYLVWFQTQREKPEVSTDPVSDMPLALVVPTFENFIEWYQEMLVDPEAYEEKVKNKETDVKKYDIKVS